MSYIKITGTKHEVIEELPLAYGMISNYHLCDQSIHNQDGFYKLDLCEPIIGEDEVFSVVPNEYEYIPAKNTYVRKFIISKKEPEKSPETILEDLHIKNLKERFTRLSVTDWVELPSAVARMSESEHQAWLEYRQKLRDCVKVDDPKNVVWPTAPYSPLLGSDYPHGHIS